MKLVIVCVIAYLLGSIPSGFLVGKMMGIEDIRDHGSGNTGATNTFRVLGAKAGIITFLLDAFKGSLAVLIGRYVGHDTLYEVLAAACVILGHSYTLFLNFKGGKGVATAAGAMLVLSWPVLVINISLWAVIVILTKYVSLASILAIGTAPITSLLLHNDIKIVIFVSVLAILIVIRHKENIKRLLNGTENKITKDFGKKKS